MIRTSDFGGRRGSAAVIFVTEQGGIGHDPHEGWIMRKGRGLGKSYTVITAVSASAHVAATIAAIGIGQVMRMSGPLLLKLLPLVDLLFGPFGQCAFHVRVAASAAAAGSKVVVRLLAESSKTRG